MNSRVRLFHLLRCLIPAAVISLGAAAAEAQIRVGVTGGPTLSTLLVEDGIFDLETRRGVAVEMRLEVPVTNRFSVVARPGFVQRGARNADLGATIEYDYVSLPVLAQMRIDAGGVRPFVAAGLAPAVAVTRQVRNVIISEDGTTGVLDISNSTRPFDLTAELEAGIEMPRRRGPDFVIAARYARGLMNTAREGEGSVYNQTLGLTAGLIWTL